MRYMSSNEIRNMFLNYFKERDHQIIESASLIPYDDKSLLWVNAGVTPLKKYFDGTVVPSNRRMTSCQKCLRTGDIDSVGRTSRHHTFFEMLGNFSIGDYFKKEALSYAFELLTSDKYFAIPKELLYMTVYTNDTEAYDIWRSLGVNEDHIIKLDNNYWCIGEGPSGPDSEIFFDRGVKYDKDNIGITLLKEEIDNDRYIEIWNNVFSQYNAKDGQERDEYEELPSKNIDTGMGLERMCTILQGKDNNYETDLFMPIINKIESIAELPYNGQMAFKVIADHIKTLTFTISDGATFENYGRGYVLRRLLRRAVRYGKNLNINRPFLAELVDVVVEVMGEFYPYLASKKSLVKEMVTKEEELFQKTLLSGEKRLNEIFENGSEKIISGEDAFKLYDTYGFPIELTSEYASEKGFVVDMDGFNAYMNAQKEMARENRKNNSSMNLQNEALINYKDESKFVGYDKLGLETEVIGLYKDDKFVDEISDCGYMVLLENPFYAESGGQVSDIGYLKNDNLRAEVVDVVKAPNGQHLLKVNILSGNVKKGDKVLTHVLQERREDICKNHSSVHLLQKALQQLLGDTVHQAGSRVDDETLRFDFTYHGKLSDEMIVKVENMVNDKINTNSDVITTITDLDTAKKMGAMALFEDKYKDKVRVLKIADSIELCGGTHVRNTKDIKKFAILSVTNKGADTYRIEATTDDNIEKLIFNYIKPYNDEMTKLLNKAKKILSDASSMDIKLDFTFDIDNSKPTSYKDIAYNKYEYENLKLKLKDLEKRFIIEKEKLAIKNIDTFTNAIRNNGDVKHLVVITEDYEINVLKQIVDEIINKEENIFILIANVVNDNVNFICKTNINKDSINAGEVVKKLSSSCGGNGGGNKFFAQGGGRDITNLKQYLEEVKVNL